LCKHQDALSIDKYNLGLAKDFKHKIHLKTQDPFYRKKFKSPEAHHQFIEQTLDEWLKLGVVKRSNSLAITHPFSAFQRKKAKDSGLSRTIGN
jgi:phenylacetate-coenzyme A ligase PaaK-like adenylate-forming protein